MRAHRSEANKPTPSGSAVAASSSLISGAAGNACSTDNFDADAAGLGRQRPRVDLGQFSVLFAQETQELLRVRPKLVDQGLEPLRSLHAQLGAVGSQSQSRQAGAAQQALYVAH
jgi:hypothetical protein